MSAIPTSILSAIGGGGQFEEDDDLFDDEEGYDEEEGVEPEIGFEDEEVEGEILPTEFEIASDEDEDQFDDEDENGEIKPVNVGLGRPRQLVGTADVRSLASPYQGLVPPTMTQVPGSTVQLGLPIKSTNPPQPYTYNPPTTTYVAPQSFPLQTTPTYVPPQGFPAFVPLQPQGQTVGGQLASGFIPLQPQGPSVVQPQVLPLNPIAPQPEQTVKLSGYEQPLNLTVPVNIPSPSRGKQSIPQPDVVISSNLPTLMGADISTITKEKLAAYRAPGEADDLVIVRLKYFEQLTEKFPNMAPFQSFLISELLATKLMYKTGYSKTIEDLLDSYSQQIITSKV